MFDTMVANRYHRHNQGAQEEQVNPQNWLSWQVLDPAVTCIMHSKHAIFRQKKIKSFSEKGVYPFPRKNLRFFQTPEPENEI